MGDSGFPLAVVQVIRYRNGHDGDRGSRVTGTTNGAAPAGRRVRWSRMAGMRGAATAEKGRR